MTHMLLPADLSIWGPVSEWGSAVMATASLVVSLFVFRDSSRRQASADAELVTAEGDYMFTQGQLDSIRVKVVNGASRPIFECTLLIRLSQTWPSGEPQWMTHSASTLDPGVTKEVVVTIGADSGARPEFLRFRDSAGQRWLRSIATGRLVRMDTFDKPRERRERRAMRELARETAYARSLRLRDLPPAWRAHRARRRDRAGSGATGEGRQKRPDQLGDDV